MSAKKQATNVVKVSILGDEYSIRSDASPEHTRAVAQHVDSVIRQIMSGSQMVESHKAAILAAISITGELFEARETGGSLAGSMQRLSNEIRPWLPPSKRKD
jgi:cell division protein ZapA